MARRPEGVSREAWLAQRARHWKRINRALTIAMLVVVAAVLARNCPAESSAAESRAAEDVLGRGGEVRDARHVRLDLGVGARAVAGPNE